MTENLNTAPRKPKIVILDDEKDIVEVYTEMLGLKYQVLSFTDIEEYFVFLASCKKGLDTLQDLLITDYNLGQRLNGLDVVEETRKLNKRIPFILISGYFNPATSAVTNDYGAHYVLEKPLDYNKLDEMINDLLIAS